MPSPSSSYSLTESRSSSGSSPMSIFWHFPRLETMDTRLLALFDALGGLGGSESSKSCDTVTIPSPSDLQLSNAVRSSMGSAETSTSVLSTFILLQTRRLSGGAEMASSMSAVGAGSMMLMLFAKYLFSWSVFSVLITLVYEQVTNRQYL